MNKFLTCAITTFSATGSSNFVTDIKEKINGAKDSISNIGESLDSIANFFGKITYYASNPLVFLKDFVDTILPLAHFGALAMCAFVILMAIVGHKKGLKYVPVTFMAYLFLNIISAVL